MLLAGPRPQPAQTTEIKLSMTYTVKITKHLKMQNWYLVVYAFHRYKCFS